MPSSRPLYPHEMALLRRRAEAPATSLPANRQPTVTVVLLSLDRLHLTRRCIDSIYAHAEYPFALFIHDDGSQPETIEYLRALRAVHANIELFESPERLGCAAARNRAFARVETEYVFSLDNDIICQPGWLREAMACAVRHDAAFVEPLRLEPDGTVWAFAPTLLRTGDAGVLEIARWFHDLPPATVQAWFARSDVATNFISGGAGLYARAAFDACGGFAEIYGVGFEDLDFSLQMAARGYGVWATAHAALIHDDRWQPVSAADRHYAERRYDLDVLRAAAARFKQRWGVEVLPDKYLDSFRHRLASKLGNGG